MQFSLKVIFSMNKLINNEETGEVEELETTSISHISDRMAYVYDNNMIVDRYNALNEKFSNNLEVYQNNGSGWIIRIFESLSINYCKYKPCNGSSYIDLPDKIKT